MNTKLIIMTCAVFGFGSFAYAGSTTFSTKETATVPAAPQSWYADNEFNVSLWGAYAFTGTNNERSSLADTFFATPRAGTYDRFLGDDHAFGGGSDAKYFFRRYFGVGVEAFALAAHGPSYTVKNFGTTAAFKGSDDYAVGAVLGTLTLRYPIASTRFSPYVWAGGGEIFGGRNDTADYVDGNLQRITHEVESRGLGQFGGGLEVRFTRHIGMLTDFSWNVVDGRNNNFGMVRSGINFAF